MLRKDHLALLGLLLLTALAYSPLLNAGFAWDDSALVANNKLTSDLSNLPAFFTTDLWQTLALAGTDSGYYRPLTLVSLAVDQALFGLNPAAHHAHSVLWHLAAVTALWALLRRLVDPAAALLGAAIFALHPVQSEAVALIAARNDSMAAAMILGALVVLMPPERRPLRALAAAGLALGALLSKESAILAPALLLTLDLARFGRPRGWLRYAALGAAVLVFLGMRTAAGIGGADLPPSSSWGLFADNLHRLVATYGSMLVFPWPLTPARHLRWMPEQWWPQAVGALVLFGLLLAALLRARDRRLVWVGLVWAGLSFAPTLYATLNKGLLGERYLYLPVAGLALVAAGALRGLPRLPWLTAALLVPALVILQLRLPQWESSLTLWRAAHESSSSPYTHGGYAFYVHQSGDIEGSERHFMGAVAGDPPYVDACTHIVMVPLQLRDPQRAVKQGRWGLTERGCPPIPETVGHYALALATLGEWRSATELVGRMDRDPFGHKLLITAAARVRAGDRGALEELAPQWRGQIPLERQVGTLLGLAERNAAQPGVQPRSGE